MMSKPDKCDSHFSENVISTSQEYHHCETTKTEFDPWIELSMKNLAWNIDQVKNKIEGTPIMAVVKCNAYGHGIVGIAKQMQKNQIDRFAVVKVYEAVALRTNSIEGMILNFGGFSSSEAEQLVEFGISQSVYSDTVIDLQAAAQKLNKKAKVHIKVDTGLGRVGVPYQNALSYIEKVASMPNIQIEGIFTSLTEEDDYDPIQEARLLEIYRAAEKRGFSLGVRHAASSLAVAHYTPPFLDMVRPGNCFFGIEPLPGMSLRPVMSMKTRVIYIKELNPGDTIGYHRAFKIEKKCRLATLPLGYSDGYPLSAVNKSQVLINGQRWPMIGYMSANHVFADITGNESIKIGDEVVLFGKQGTETISIGEVAEWAGNSVYFTAVSMNPFLKRIFL